MHLISVMVHRAVAKQLRRGSNKDSVNIQNDVRMQPKRG